MVFGPAVDSKQELQRLRNVKYSVLIFKKSSSFDPYLTDFITQLQFYTSAITSLSLSGIRNTILHLVTVCCCNNNSISSPMRLENTKIHFPDQCQFLCSFSLVPWQGPPSAQPPGMFSVRKISSATFSLTHEQFETVKLVIYMIRIPMQDLMVD